MKRLAFAPVVLFALLPVGFSLGGDGKQAFKSETFTGKVLPLAALLKKQDIKLDDDAAPHSLALVTDDGKVYLLVKDAGARMFFTDAKLLHRPMRLTGRTLANANLLQVVNAHSLVKNELHEIFYWCDICTIRAYERGDCGCCGAPLEFREVPVKK